MIRGIRGAITVDGNTSLAIEQATTELLNELFFQNGIDTKLISHIIFTLTEDLNAEFPAKIAREKLGLNDVAMMCFNELNVPGSLKMCLRVLVVLNCDESFVPRFVYLKDAKNLRG